MFSQLNDANKKNNQFIKKKKIFKIFQKIINK